MNLCRISTCVGHMTEILSIYEQTLIEILNVKLKPWSEWDILKRHQGRELMNELKIFD